MRQVFRFKSGCPDYATRGSMTNIKDVDIIRSRDQERSGAQKGQNNDKV